MTTFGGTAARIVAVALFVIGVAFFLYGAWFASMWGVSPFLIFPLALAVVTLLGILVAIIWLGTKVEAK